MSANALAHAVYEWARSNGALAEVSGLTTGEPQQFTDLGEGDLQSLNYAQERLSKGRLVGVIANEADETVTVVTKGLLGPRVVKSLPDQIDGVAVRRCPTLAAPT